MLIGLYIMSMGANHQREMEREILGILVMGSFMVYSRRRTGRTLFYMQISSAGSSVLEMCILALSYCVGHGVQKAIAWMA